MQREKGWQVVDVYQDAGFSGKDLERPALHRLLSDAHQGKIDVVVTYKLDRISRSLRDFYGFWEVLKRHGVTFVPATQNFDTSDSAGNLMPNILLSFAQYERELTMERTATKMKARAQRGKWNGGWVPMGYDYIADDQRLVPHGEEAQIVRTMFDLVIAHGKLNIVRDQLNALGYRTKSRAITGGNGEARQVGNNRFSYDAIKSIVQNPVHKGCIRHEDQLFPGGHEPLVSEDIWEQANATLTSRYKPRPRRVGLMPKDDRVHLLKGLITCADCGSTMTPYPAGKKDKHGRPYLYYSCTQVVEHGKHSKCKVRSLPARQFEAVVVEALSDLGRNPALLEECVRQANEEAEAALGPLQERKEGYEQRLAVLAQEICRLIEVLKSRDDAPDDLKAQLLRLDGEKQELKKEIEKIGIDISRRRRHVIDLDIIQQSLRDFDRLTAMLPADDQKELMQLLIQRIEVAPYDPRTQNAPTEEGAFTTKIRTGHYRVNIRLHQIPRLAARVNRSGASSDSSLDWLPDVDSNHEHTG